MKNQDLDLLITRMMTEVGRLIPEYMENADDRIISNGNIAICIIDESGCVYGRMYGTNKPRLRQSYRVAWTKASQVWLTGMKTGEYERRLFNKEIPENSNGIESPDLIGWEGGQPATLPDGTKLSIGVSGLRGVSDLEIAQRALKNIAG